MARRSDHTRDELTKLILDAAFDLVNKGGYSSVSTRKIAANIGYTVGTLYNVFTNLDDIFIHINARVADIFLSKVKAVIEENNSPKEALYLLAYECLKFSEQNYNLWNVLFEYRFPDKQLFPTWYYTKINELFSLVEKTVAKTVKNKTQEMKVISGMMWAGIHGICTLSVKGKFARVGVTNSELMIKNFLDTMLKGINE